MEFLRNLPRQIRIISGITPQMKAVTTVMAVPAVPAVPAKKIPNPPFVIPVLENIHQKVLQAVSQPNALKMSDWHTCDTTHCRAGWVVVLAGEKGKKLEEKTSTLFAAMEIYHKSSPDIPVSPTQFFKSNERATEDIIRCAELEKQQNL